MGRRGEFAASGGQAQNGISRAFSNVRAGGGLRPDREISERIEGIMVSLNFASWNQITEWLRAVNSVRRAA